MASAKASVVKAPAKTKKYAERRKRKNLKNNCKQFKDLINPGTFTFTHRICHTILLTNYCEAQSIILI